MTDAKDIRISAIAKMIAEYQDKIKDCDTLLDSYKARNAEIRREIREEGFPVEHSAMEKYEIERDRVHQSSQRQAYVQAIADFEAIDIAIEESIKLVTGIPEIDDMLSKGVVVTAIQDAEFNRSGKSAKQALNERKDK